MSVENSDLAKKVKIGDHIIVSNGKGFLKVTGFKDEEEFLEEQKQNAKPDSRIAKISK